MLYVRSGDDGKCGGSTPDSVGYRTIEALIVIKTTFRIPIAAVVLALLLSRTFLQLFAEESLKKDERRPAPIAARLIVKKAKYVLPKEQHGKAFRNQIAEETDTDNLPPPQKVNLVLELKNTSQEDVMIWPRGAITYPDLIVEGPGVVQPENLTTISGESSGTSVQPTIAPGETHRITITSLNPNGGTTWFYWCEPGEYTIKASYKVHTGLPPFPFPDNKKVVGRPQQYEVTTPPVKVQVVLEGEVATAEEPTRPLIVAHRGLLEHTPENTLANFRACLELHMGFEFDVQRTKDGHLVCIHDDTVNRTTNGTGKVADLTLEEIRLLDAGNWFDRTFTGEKVPTIEEVVALIADHHEKEVLIAVDLKAAGVEQYVVRMAERHKVLDRLLFIGRTISEATVRESIKAASKKAQTATVANNADEFSRCLAAPDTDCVYFRYLPPMEQMQAVRESGKRTFIAGTTVSGNIPDNWRQAANLGIDGILTDFPLELRTILRKSR